MRLALAILLASCAAPPTPPTRAVTLHVKRAPTLTLHIPGPPNTWCDFDDGGPRMWVDDTGFGWTDFEPASYPINDSMTMWCGGEAPVTVRIVETIDP